jgi:hypothetical protein
LYNRRLLGYLAHDPPPGAFWSEGGGDADVCDGKDDDCDGGVVTRWRRTSDDLRCAEYWLAPLTPKQMPTMAMANAETLAPQATRISARSAKADPKIAP